MRSSEKRKRMILFIFFLCARATLVPEWFDLDWFRWHFVKWDCHHIAVMFSDDAWLDLTLQTVQELRAPAVCFALVLWLHPNSTKPALCSEKHNTCMVLHRNLALAKWGTPQYFTKIAERLPIVSAILQSLPLDPHRGVALIDSDVTFLRRNFFARIERSTLHSFVAQQEWPCATAPLADCVNGGVWWMRRTELGRTLLREAESLMHVLAVPDQDALTLVSARYVNATKFLDRLKYANGYTVQNDGAWRHGAAHMVHANWLTGLVAKAKLLSAIRNTPKFRIY